MRLHIYCLGLCNEIFCTFSIIFGKLDLNLYRLEERKIRQKKLEIFYKYIQSITQNLIKIGYMWKGEEGRGLLQFEMTYKGEMINIAEYLKTKYKDKSL